MQNENDKLLVSLLKKNEVKAFDALFQKYSDKLFHFSFSLFIKLGILIKMQFSVGELLYHQIKCSTI